MTAPPPAPDPVKVVNGVPVNGAMARPTGVGYAGTHPEFKRIPIVEGRSIQPNLRSRSPGTASR